MDFELRHLRYALAVADHRSFRRAAEALGVHQSALSRRVRDFEDRVGISLFERGRGGVRPTIAGEALLRDVRRSIHTLERTIGRAGAVGRAEHGRLLIGYAGSLVSTRMLSLLASLKERSGSVELHLTEGITSSLIQSAFDRRIDVALLRTPVNPPGLDVLPLWREELLIAAAERHPVARLQAVTAQHLRGERLLLAHSNDWTDVHRGIQQELGPEVRMTFHECHREAILMLAAAGFGLALVGSSAAYVPFSGVVFVPLEASLPALEVTAAWSPNADNPALRRFLCVLREHQDDAGSRVNGRAVV